MTQRTPDGRAPCPVCDSMRFLIGWDGQTLRPCPKCMETVRLNDPPKDAKADREQWQARQKVTR